MERTTEWALQSVQTYWGLGIANIIIIIIIIIIILFYCHFYQRALPQFMWFYVGLEAQGSRFERRSCCGHRGNGVYFSAVKFRLSAVTTSAVSRSRIRFQRLQSKALRLIVDAPRYVPNTVIRRDLQTPKVKE
jgi:hypothetical protein